MIVAGLIIFTLLNVVFLGYLAWDYFVGYDNQEQDNYEDLED